MNIDQRALELLRSSLGKPTARFHEGQLEAIKNVVEKGKRLLLVRQTGWGKSMVYFISSALLRQGGAGPTLIISPLLALMRNQVEAAVRIGMRAETINSDNMEEWSTIREKMTKDEVDILLISPERLANNDFIKKFLIPVAGRIALIVIDEAHCISDWGHDFRPDYRRITRIIKQLPPNISVLATTATANERVVQDVKSQLGESLVISRGALNRTSLALQNISLPNQAVRLAWLAHNLPKIEGSGIIYTLTQRDADRVARWLCSKNILVAAYHGAVEGVRAELEQKLLRDELKALVATSALGMGFDKPNLSFVIHYQAPQSLVHYYQQVGRAGRALDYAYGILLGGEEDQEINEHFIGQAFPHERQVNEIIDALDNSNGGLSIPELEHYANLRKTQIDKVIKLLSAEDSAPIIKTGTKWQRTTNAYKIDTARVQRLAAKRQAEWKQMQDYMASKSCIMQFISLALDDPYAQPCRKCSNCLGREILAASVPQSLINEAMMFLKRGELSLEPRKRWASNAFPTYGWTGNIAKDLLNEKGKVLCRWRDVGWGTLIELGKQENRFSDELVNGSVEMISSRWAPSPAPTWVTCIPSLNNPTLVPDIANRIAQKLRLPFFPLVKKIKATAPQKTMMNSTHQAHNLDGAFSIEGNLPVGPVLLIDDVVDSGWSMTVVGALLRSAGSGPVYPYALALASASAD